MLTATNCLALLAPLDLRARQMKLQAHAVSREPKNVDERKLVNGWWLIYLQGENNTKHPV